MVIVNLILASIVLLLGISFIISGFVGIFKRFSFSDYKDKDRVIINILFGIINILLGIFLIENIFILKSIFMSIVIISLIIAVVFDIKTKSQSKKTYGGGPSDGE